MADIDDAAHWIKKLFQSALSPHGPGKNRSTTEALRRKIGYIVVRVDL